MALVVVLVILGVELELAEPVALSLLVPVLKDHPDHHHNNHHQHHLASYI